MQKIHAEHAEIPFATIFVAGNNETSAEAEENMPTTDIQARIAHSPIVTAFAGLLALAVAMGIGRFAFTPVLPMMLEDVGLSIAQGGLLASANYAGYLIGAISATLIRIRPAIAIRAGLVIIAITTLAMGLHFPFAGWLVMRLLAGIASAWVLISISTWSLETLAKYQRPVLSSVVFAGVGVGIAIAGLTCIALSNRGATSSQAWVTLGLLSAAATAFIWPLFYRQDESPGNNQTDIPTKHRWNAESIRLVVCYGIFGFGYIIPATFLPVMAKHALRDPALFGWSWPVFGLAAAISTLAVAPLSRYVSSRHLWIAGHVILALGVALPAVRSNPATVFVAALFVGGTFMVITLGAMQEAKRVAGRDATVLIAAMTSSFAAGQIAGPLSITYGLGRDGGFSTALLIAAALLLVGAFALSGRSASSQPAAG
jgi:MFS family permease